MLRDTVTVTWHIVRGHMSFDTTAQITGSPHAASDAGSGFFDFSANEAIVIGLVTSIVQFSMAFVRGISAETDFAIFQATAARFAAGQRMYSASSTDFTPPIFHVLLLPLAHLDPRIGFILWTLANVAVACLVVTIVLRSVPVAPWRRAAVVALVTNAAGVQMTIRLGQVSWIAALIVTLAWVDLRSGRHTTAGAWAGVAIALKPFLLLAIPVFVVRRQWKALATCILAILTSCLLSIGVFGELAFADWIQTLRAVPDPDYATHFLNASWVALTSRAHLPYFVGLSCSAATVGTMLWLVRTRNEDETWMLLLTGALLACPMGWVYYQPILLGPVVALAMAGRLTPLGLIVIVSVVPALNKDLFQHGSVLVALTIGSVYFWSFATLFVRSAWMSATPSGRPSPSAETTNIAT